MKNTLIRLAHRHAIVRATIGFIVLYPTLLIVITLYNEATEIVFDAITDIDGHVFANYKEDK